MSVYAKGGSGAGEMWGNPIQASTEDLASLRNKWNVPETDTIAVGRTDIKGLQDILFEGGSPKVRQEAGLPSLDAEMPYRKIRAPYKNSLFVNHAEEGVINQFDNAVQKSGINPVDVEGSVYILQSNPKGVCNKCTAGLIEGGTNKSGIIKQISEKYPNVTFHISSETIEGVQPNGLLNFKVKNGKIID